MLKRKKKSCNYISTQREGQESHRQMQTGGERRDQLGHGVQSQVAAQGRALLRRSEL